MPAGMKPFSVAVIGLATLCAVIAGGIPTFAMAESNPAQTAPPAPPVRLVEKGGKGMMKEACGEDVKKLCQGVKPGGGRIMQCLDQHVKEVSPDCAKLLERRAQKREQHPSPQQQ